MKETKFKQTDIGLIPEDWKIDIFDKVFKFLSTNTYAREFMDEKTGDVHNIHYGDILVKYGSIVDFERDSVPYLKQSIESGVERNCLKNGDLIIADTAEDETAGKTAEIFNLGGKKAVAGLHTFACRPKIDFASKYLGYFSNCAFFHNQMLPYFTGTKVTSISKSCIKKIFVAYPSSKDEQKRIANALSQVDDLLAALDEQIEKKKLIKQGTMQQLLTGKIRLKESNDYKMTELGMIPSDWSVKNVGELLKIGHGHDYKNLNSGNVPVYGTGGYMTSVNDFLYDGETVCIGRKGTINKPFYHTGKIWTVDTLFYTYGFNGCIPKFIYYAFCLVDWLAMNEASGVPSLTSQNIENVLLRIPSSEAEQAAIASTLSTMDEEIQALQEERDKYALVKQGMMQQLLTGKIRLN